MDLIQSREVNFIYQTINLEWLKCTHCYCSYCFSCDCVPNWMQQLNCKYGRCLNAWESQSLVLINVLHFLVVDLINNNNNRATKWSKWIRCFLSSVGILLIKERKKAWVNLNETYLHMNAGVSFMAPILVCSVTFAFPRYFSRIHFGYRILFWNQSHHIAFGIFEYLCHRFMNIVSILIETIWNEPF